MTKYELAKRLGVKEQTVYNWWARQAKGGGPGKKLWPKLARVLETSIDYLIGFNDRPSPEFGNEAYKSLHKDLGAGGTLDFSGVSEAVEGEAPPDGYADMADDVRSPDSLDTLLLGLTKGLPLPSPKDSSFPAAADASATAGADLPLLLARFEESVHEVAQRTADAILHQEQEFVGQMRIIGSQLTLMGSAIEKRDADMASILRTNNQIIQALAARLESSDQALRESRQALAVNQQALAANQATMEASNRLIESQSHALDANRKTLEQVKSRLDDPSDDCGDDDAAEDDGTHGPSRGPR